MRVSTPNDRRQNQGHCPSRDQLANYVTGKLPGEAADILEGHVGQCSKCQATLDEFGDLSDRLILSIRNAAADHAGFEDKELYELARRAATASLEATRDTTETAAGKQLAAEITPDEEPRRLGQYRLAEKLGQGGMGTVYRALHPKLKREVAIKVLPAHRRRDPQAIERFHREMEAVGRVDHPNIVRAHDAGEASGRYFLVMEFLEGVTLAQLVRSDEPISTGEACRVIRQAALGIQHAHDHGLIHRDIKPSNLMRLPDGTICLWDVGTGRQTHRFDDSSSPVSAVGFCNTFSTSGRYAVSAGADGTMRFWRLPDLVAETDRIPVPDEVLVVVPGEDLPSGEWVNLLAPLDVEVDRVRGDWRREADHLTTGNQEYSRIMLPVSLEGDYDLTAEFTRLAGNDTVCFVLPVGQRACRLCLSGWQGAVHGLESVDGRRVNDPLNPTARPLGSLVSGRRYHLSVGVRLEGENAHIQAALDGEPLFDWEGEQTSLEIPPGWTMPDPTRPGLGTLQSPTRFHSALLRSVSGKASMVRRHDKHREDVSPNEWIDLLGRLDPDTERFDRGRSGDEWRRSADGIVADVSQAGEIASTMLPVIVEGSYQLEVQFTRTGGNELVAVLLPAGPLGSAVVLSERGGKLSGIDRIDGRDVAHNPTAQRPGTLVNGQRYTVLAVVPLRPPKRRCHAGWLPVRILPRHSVPRCRRHCHRDRFGYRGSQHAGRPPLALCLRRFFRLRALYAA